MDTTRFWPVIPRPAQIKPVVEGLNPPNLIRPPVVEDVDSDEEDDDDDDDYVEANAARQTNMAGNNVDTENVGNAPQLGHGSRVRTPPDY